MFINGFTDADRDVLYKLSRDMARCARRLDDIVRAEQQMEREMALDFSKMLAAATKQTTVTNSVLQYLSDQSATLADIRKQLADAIAANDPAAVKAAQDALDAFAAGVDENDDKIAAAIAAPGTPGTPPPSG